MQNRTSKDLSVVFSFHTSIFFGPDCGITKGKRRVTGEDGRLEVEFIPEAEEDKNTHGWFSVESDVPDSITNAAWMRGHRFHATMSNWKFVLNGELPKHSPYPETDAVQSPGGSIYSPIFIPAESDVIIVLRFCWYVPESTLREDEPVLMQETECQKTYLETYRPWYSSHFSSIEAVREYWTGNYIRPITRRTHAASDGQLGGVLKTYREYRISGDKQWLAHLWPKVKKSLEYCINEWDREKTGQLKYPHHTTYDITIWGPDSLAQSMYVAALKAAVTLAEIMGENTHFYNELYKKAKTCYEEELFNGEYFCQKVMFRELGIDYENYNNEFIDAGHPEIDALMEKEGPPYQYGKGCLSDGAIGDYLALCCGLDSGIDQGKIESHLESVFTNNFRESLRRHANPMRSGYALEDESGLLVCSWPRGEKPTLPLLYSDEVWTGIEYQVATHLAMKGYTNAALKLVESTRNRYDGSRRNPYNEYECGHFYGRALASYALLQAFGGVRYDAVDKTLHIMPNIQGDFSVFLSTDFGYGLAGVRDGKPFFDAAEEREPVINHINYMPYRTDKSKNIINVKAEI